ncbi:MAG: Hint domain-containing protein, partial [Parcubacteria group bacterium]
GNVGIGTTGPGGKLHVVATGDGIISDVTTTNYAFKMKVSGVDKWGFYTTAADSFALREPGVADYITVLKTSGNVGIGEVAPGSKLSVSGGGSFGAGYDTTAAPTNGLIIEGNVGIGTTNPGSNKLQVEGQCVTGDTLLPIRRRKKRKGSDADVDDNEGNDDGYDYLIVPIKDILPGDEVLSLNKYTGLVEYRPIKALMDMGVKKVYKLTTKSGRVIRTTSTHPYLVKMSDEIKGENRVKKAVKFIKKYITNDKQEPEISESREISGLQTRDTEIVEDNIENIGTSKIADICPYCLSKDFVKRGTRKNKHQVVQLYVCRKAECGRTFTAQDVKGKHFPLNVLIESMSYYNLGFNLEQTCRIIKQKFGVSPEPATLSDWINEYKPLCRYERLRPYAIKMFDPKNVVEVTTMAHRQLYRFRYHRAKIVLMLEEFKNRNLYPLKEYLDAVSTETPHQYFQDGERMSEIRSKFDKAGMIVRGKKNFANKLAQFVLQSVAENKQRHEELQRFMIANDSCTVATEVPVYIRKEDIEHMENVLKFKISDDGLIEMKGQKEKQKMPRLLTGHIDIVQVRNGSIHLLDYKPKAEKEKPIEQLTWYAMALSRLTGLRLYNFVCGWFDEKEYFQFYPLHVVKKLQDRKRRKFVRFKDGTKVEVPRSTAEIVISRSNPK